MAIINNIIAVRDLGSFVSEIYVLFVISLLLLDANPYQGADRGLITQVTHNSGIDLCTNYFHFSGGGVGSGKLSVSISATLYDIATL